MPRRPLARGQHTPPTFEVKEPEEERFQAISRLPVDYRPPRGSVWRARCSVRLAGGIKRMSAQGRTKAIAEKRLLEAIAIEFRSDGLTGVNDTLGERVQARVDDILEGKVSRIRAQRSKDTYESIARTWCVNGSRSEIADIRVTELTAGDLNREAERIANLGAASQLKHIRALWTAALQEAVDDGVLSTNPVRSMSALPKPRPSETDNQRRRSPRLRNTLTDDEIAQTIATAQAERYRELGIHDFILLSLYTGLRIGELVSLRWQDIHLEEAAPLAVVRGKIVRIKGQGLQWEGYAKTEGSERTVLLSPPAVAVLRRRKAAVEALGSQATSADRTWVLTSSVHTTPDPDNFNKYLRRLFDEAGLPWATNHTIRRTVENRLKRRGVSDIDLESIFGHTGDVARKHYWDRHALPLDAKPHIDALAEEFDALTVPPEG